MAAVIYTEHFAQFFDNNGDPLSEGKLFAYSAGTTTPKPTFTTAAGDVQNAHPIVLDAAGRATLFIEGSYRFDLFDKNDVLIKSTDNVTSFSTLSDAGEAFFQTFSGDGENVSFTLNEDLGTDEKGIMVFTTRDYVTNGNFSSDTGWTKGTGWTITGGEAVATGAISTALEQPSPNTISQGQAYSVKYTITRSAGSVTLSVGGNAGQARSASGTYYETIFAGSTQTISFGTSGFTGTIDNVDVTSVAGQVILNPNEYTVNGTSLIFNVAPANGTNNIEVFAPTKLLGAASAAAGLAQSAQGAAEAARDEAQAAAGLLDISSTTSLAIGTGSKVFTIAADKGVIAGQYVLITSDADPTNFMYGSITTYSGTSLTVDVTSIGGSGTLADWTITLIGIKGVKGDTGSITNIDGLPTAAPALNDTAIFTDVSDSNETKKATFSSILDLVNSSGWVPLQTQTVTTGVSSVEFTTGIDGTYKKYAIVVSALRPSTDAVEPIFRVSSDGGSTYDNGSSNYEYVNRSYSTSNLNANSNSNSSTAISFVNSNGNDTGESTNFLLFMNEPNSTSVYKTFEWVGSVYYSNGILYSMNGAGSRKTSTQIDAIQFSYLSGNIASGTFTLYGLAGA